MILAIDPGDVKSAYALLDQELKPRDFGILPNEELIEKFYFRDFRPVPRHFAIEMVASYGMPVGKTTFETCLWIGRFIQAGTTHLPGIYDCQKIFRKSDVCMNLCHNTRAKDANIRQALIDRFGVVGTKKNPGWFYGVSKDVWSAIAVGVTYNDLYLNEQRSLLQMGAGL